MYNNSSPSQGIRFTFLTQSDQSKFEQIFSQTAAAFGGNKISAQAVSELLRRSNLDNDSLAKIWDLASIANAPHLTFPEFAVAMWLTSKKLTGQQLPASLPPNIREETEIAMATIASTETPQPQPQQQQQQLVNTSIPQYNTPMMTGMPPQMTGMPQQQQPMMTGMPPQQTPMMTGMPPQQQNMMTGMPQQFRPQLPMQTGFNSMAPIQTAMQTGYIQPQTAKPRLQNLDFAKKMMPNQSGVTNLLNPSLGTSDANRISWKISPEDKQRYRDIFNAWEGSGSGFMSGDTAKDVLTQSGLPPADLMKIWNLSDMDNKGSLDVDEFAVAMHLVYRKMNGFEIPAVLPSELKPPSSVLKKFILGRRPPPSKPSFSPQPQQEESSDDDDSYGQYTSSARRKGPQSASSSRYHTRYDEPDEDDVLILEDLRRQIAETKRQLDRMPAPKYNSTRSITNNTKYSLEELKEKIRRAQDDLNQASLHNPLFQKYTQNSETLLELLETEKSLQDEIQYLCNRDIPVLARQLRGAAAELRDTKVRYSRKNDGTQDYMAFIQPTGPGGSISEGDRVRAKAKAMMAARKAGNTGNSTDAAYGLRRAEEEKEEADKKADSIERDMERSRTALLDMRGDLRYLEEMTAVQDLEDKKRFENNPQELSYELRRFIEQLNSKAAEPSPYTSSPRVGGGYQSTGGYQSPSMAASSPTVSSATASPKPKVAAARPRTAEEIKKEAERRVQERLAALQAKRNPGSPRSIPSKSSTPPVSKPDEAEVAAQQRLREAEREAQEMLRQSVSQREETDRKNREAELERLRETERLERQRLEDLEKETAERERQEEEQRKLDDEREEREFQERRRQVLAKEEADRQARFDAIRREEEEAEQKKQEHKPEEVVAPTPPAPAAAAAAAAPPPPPPAPAAPPAAPPASAAPAATSGSSNNPFAKLQNAGSSQAEKPNEAANKRVSYNPFAAFSAFSATKGGAKDDSDSEEDDGWGNDDSDDDNEFPAAGSAKNLAGKLFSAMSKRENSGSLETVREVAPSPKPNESDIPPPPPPPTGAASEGIPPPPPAPAAPIAPPAPAAPVAAAAAPPPSGGGDMRNALLSQIQMGTKLKKAVTNDRSGSSIAGHVVDDGSSNHTPVQPVPAPEIAAPAPISAPLSSGGFLAELQARTTGSSPEAPAPAAAEPEVETAPPKHDESLPETEYIALWDYPGSGADDLIFSQDDIILVRDNNDAEDWWFGTLEKSGKTGYFPRNYVQLKPEAVPELNIQTKALYDFDGPEGQGCLSFKMGDTVTVLVKENDDWWKAKSEQGQVGLVPANYLEQI